MLNKPRKSFMQPMTVCLPWLNSCRCYTQSYARLSNYLAATESWLISVWIFFMWYQKLKFSCMVVFIDEGTFGPSAKMLNRGSTTNLLTWEVMLIYPSRQCFLILCHRTHLYSTNWHPSDERTHTEIERVLRPGLFWDCMQYKVVIPFWYFGISNWSHL